MFETIWAQAVWGMAVCLTIPPVHLSALPSQGTSASQAPKDAAAPAPKELERLWAELADDNAAKARQAIRQLAAIPTWSVPLLKQRVPPVVQPTTKELGQLLADLDSNLYAVREKATRSLFKLGELALPSMREALAAKPTLEVRLRLEPLLKKMERPSLSREQVRALRAVQILEHIGTPEARQVLEIFAGGAPAAQLTQDAKAALDRLADANR